MPPQYSPTPKIITDVSELSSSPSSNPASRIPSLSLSPDQLVLPGSAVQKAVALSLSGLDVGQSEPECVICMEGFTTSDPKMLTLCECGVNKTCFHYSCLLRWTERDSTCPACRKELLWEERGAADVDWDAEGRRRDEEQEDEWDEDEDAKEYDYSSEECDEG